MVDLILIDCPSWILSSEISILKNKVYRSIQLFCDWGRRIKLFLFYGNTVAKTSTKI
jgi:hypothetical protein